MSPEDHYQKVNIPIEKDRLVDLLVYKKKRMDTLRKEEEGMVWMERRKNVSLHFQELEITIDKE